MTESKYTRRGDRLMAWSPDENPNTLSGQLSAAIQRIIDQSRTTPMGGPVRHNPPVSGNQSGQGESK